MSKILFFDIDGTLVPGGSDRASAPVTDALRQARKNGHLVFLSTGRPEKMVDEAILSIGFDGGIFSAGGKAQVKGRKIYECALEEDQLQGIIQVLSSEKDIFYLLECDTMNFRGNITEEYLSRVSCQETPPDPALKKILTILTRVSQKGVTERVDTPVYKISFFSLNQGAIERAVEKLQVYGKVLYFQNTIAEDGIYSGEINDWKVNKGMAIARICAYLGESIDNTIGFGDSLNDLEMIQAAGIGVAMGNASQEVKDKADRVCESVQEDGVALELARMGLI